VIVVNLFCLFVVRERWRGLVNKEIRYLWRVGNPRTGRVGFWKKRFGFGLKNNFLLG
jgi:hypothetical protein